MVWSFYICLLLFQIRMTCFLPTTQLILCQLEISNFPAIWYLESFLHSENNLAPNCFTKLFFLAAADNKLEEQQQQHQPHIVAWMYKIYSNQVSIDKNPCSLNEYREITKNMSYLIKKRCLIYFVILFEAHQKVNFSIDCLYNTICPLNITMLSASVARYQKMTRWPGLKQKQQLWPTIQYLRSDCSSALQLFLFQSCDLGVNTVLLWLLTKRAVYVILRAI